GLGAQPQVRVLLVDVVIGFGATADPAASLIQAWQKACAARAGVGADNGIGMASALAVLADDNVVHGPLEVLLTMTEEAGMDGAFG
ncbi:hypothetical protein ONQ62_27405, partial [Salmonella enterica subsp. enterica serovar Virginia]|nr:hypothetical protein [Salmonella enterica subsp. enterica serovar Virginia]